MSMEIRLSESGEYVECRITGPISADIALSIGKAIDACGVQYNVDRYLIDVTAARNVASVSENYRLAYQTLEEHGIRKQIRIALITDPADDSHDFPETAFHNAGYDFKIFTDKDSAMAWLGRQGVDG